MSYRKHFAEVLKINTKAIVGLIPKDGNHKNCDMSNMLLIVNPEGLISEA